MESGLVPGVKKIVVFRTLVLGDLIFILPALEALRHAYPNAEIVYVGWPWTVDFIKDRVRSIDRVVTIREATGFDTSYGWLIHPDDAAWFFPQMQAEGFDLGFQMQGGGKNSNPLLRDMRPAVSIGSREEGAIALDRWLPHDYYQHDVIRNLDLVALAGAKPLGWSPRLPVLDADRAAAAPYLKQIGGPFVVLHTGARDIRRRWPAEQFASLGDALANEYGWRVVLTGTEMDEESAQSVVQAMQHKPVDLTALEYPFSLSALVGVLAGAQMVVSNDTGVLHVALAVGTKSVGLYWSEYISKSLPLSRHNFLEVIAFDRRCPQCGLLLDQAEIVRTGPRPCLHLTSFINEITPQQVQGAVRRLLSQ